MSLGMCIVTCCLSNGLINHITRSTALTVMMTVCMMSRRHSCLLSIMLLLHGRHNITSVAKCLRLTRKKAVRCYLLDRPFHQGCDQSGAVVGDELSREFEVHWGCDYAQTCSVHGACSRLMSVVDGLSVQPL